MLIADATITKQYWEPVFEHIQCCFEDGRYYKMRGREVYTMHWKGMWLFVAASTSGKRALTVHGWLLLEQKRNWKCWEVGQSYVFLASRGEGWGRLLYDSVIQSGLILASGTQQSKTGRRMWKTMIRSDRYHIWAHDFDNPNIYEPVIYDPVTDEIWSNLPIYEKERNLSWSRSTERDIRLIAIKKSK